jgi:hypothetical protein
MFYSILFPKREQHNRQRQNAEPDFFKDLNLTQIFTPILKSKEEFDLGGFFYTPLHDPEIIVYRQEVLSELEDEDIRSVFAGFSKTVYDLGRYMETVRSSLESEDSWRNNYVTRGRMLDCADKYCREIAALREGLLRLTLRSTGLQSFAEYISDYYTSETYTELCSRVKRLREGLSTVEYCMLIKDGTIRVRKYEGQADLSKEILATFEKFRQGDVNDYRHKLSEEPHAVHVEAAVLEMLSGLYKDVFADLKDFCSKHSHFDDQTILRFSREIQF